MKRQTGRWRSAWPSVAIAGAVLLLGAGCKPAQRKEPEQPPAPARDVPASTLISTPVQVGSSEMLEVGLGACQGDVCPIEIRLKQGQDIKHAMPAAWPASNDTPQPVALDSTVGVGDPLAAADEQARVWSTGEEERTVVTVARSVHLQNGRSAVLLDQMAGYEHPKRRHDLFVVDGGKVVAAWSSVEPQGPYWSSIAIEPGKAGADALILFEAFSPDPEQPDSLTAQRLDLAGENDATHVVTSPAVVNVAIAGSFPSVAAARAARDESPECLAAFRVLDGNSVGRGHKGKFVLAAASTQRTLAEQALQHAAACAPGLKAQRIESTTIATGN